MLSFVAEWNLVASLFSCSSQTRHVAPCPCFSTVTSWLMLQRSNRVATLLRHQPPSCALVSELQRVNFAKKSQKGAQDAEIQHMVEVRPCHCIVRDQSSGLTWQADSLRYFSRALLQFLQTKETQPFALSPEEKQEWNERAKEYSRLKMTEHRAWQKVRRRIFFHAGLTRKPSLSAI